MKIYTKTGDQGETGLLAGSRVFKDDVRIEAYGDVDELNALLGLVRRHEPPAEINALLEQIQHELFTVGAELAAPDPSCLKTGRVGEQQIKVLELAIDHHDENLPPLTQFILPGGVAAASSLHLARTVCRRAERRVVALARSAAFSDFEQVLCYLNRLSDLLFVLARATNAASGGEDSVWKKTTSQEP